VSESQMVLAVLLGVLICPRGAAAATSTQADTKTAPAVIYKLGDPGVKAPVAVKQVRPKLPSSAPTRNASGVVVLDCVVQADGTVGEVTVTRSASNATMDDAAVKAAKQWTFKPGRRRGQAVAVKVPLEMTFTVIK
jgi:TonB family protein